MVNTDRTHNSTFPTHPLFDDYLEVWNTIDDCLEGSRAVKSKGHKYLPPTEGMKADAEMGAAFYNRYKHNAMYPEYAQDFFIASTGLLKQKDPSVSFPEVMEKSFIPSPSYDSEKSFYDVYSEVQDGVMRYSRCGVLLDPPASSEKKLHIFPLMTIYNTYKIINWGYTRYKGRKVLSWIVLDESYYEVSDERFSRDYKENFRFLGLKTKDSNGKDLPSPLYYTYTGEANITGIFNPPLPDDTGLAVDTSGVVVTYPNINGTYLDCIPFFCFTGTRMSLEPERPIAQSLCEACVYIYGLTADYREYLYKQGFPILFAKGMEIDTKIYTGTNKAVVVPSENADLKMVESSGNGLAEYRLAVANAEEYAKSLGLSILKNTGDETGASVAKRQGFKTASLKSISKTVGEGFTQIAKIAARWAGLEQAQIDQISVTPNLDFSATAVASEVTVFQNLADSEYSIMSDWDIYQVLRSKGVTSYNTFDEYIQDVTKTREERADYLLEQKIKETEKMNELQLKHQKAQEEMRAEMAEANASANGVDGQDDSVNVSGGVSKGAPDAPKQAEGDMSKAVVCVETGRKYKSATEASKDTGVSVAAITRNASGATKSAGSKDGKALHWKFA